MPYFMHPKLDLGSYDKILTFVRMQIWIATPVSCTGSRIHKSWIPACGGMTWGAM